MKVEDLPVLDSAKQVLINSGITQLYPPQEEAVKAGALEGRNLVLASPTASGKTLVSELCALKHILEDDSKVLYLTPLRALANEKYMNFKKYANIKKKNGRRVNVGISTGDFDRRDNWLERYDIIIMTNEKADSLLRHRPKWVNEVSLVIADEVHLLNDIERGPTLEVVLARLMQINPDTQFLALSATIKNVEDAAEWLKAESITSEWRPVALKEGVLLQNIAQFKDGSTSKIVKHRINPAINLALHTIRTGGQALIFVSTRKNSVSLAQKAASEVDAFLSKSSKCSLARLAKEVVVAGERTRISDSLAELIKQGTAFHHAGLAGAHRRLVEKAFRDGKIKVMTATPTLAFGVNLPARMVVIHDYRRYEPGYGHYPITVLEYKQMAGRAGRPSYDKFGESVLVANNEDERDYLMESYVLAQPERIWSKLAVERILRGHVLATIAADFAHTEQGIHNFFSKTFYAFQYDSQSIEEVIDKILKFLHDEKMIEFNGDDVYATRFGHRISELYIDPISGIIIKDALQRDPSVLTELCFLHLVAHTPDMFPRMRPYSSEIDELALFMDMHRSEFMFDAPTKLEDQITYENFLGEVKTAWVLQAWIEEATEEQMIEKFRVHPGDLYRVIESAQWLLYATHELALLFGHNEIIKRLSLVMKRIEKGVKAELLPIVRLEGLGRIRARILFNARLRTIDDLKNAPFEHLINLPFIGPKLAKKIKEQVGGYIRADEWKKLKKGEALQQQAITEY